MYLGAVTTSAKIDTQFDVSLSSSQEALVEMRSLVASEEHKNTERNLPTSSTSVDVSRKQDSKKLVL